MNTASVAVEATGVPRYSSEKYPFPAPWLKGRDLELVVGEALCAWWG